IHTAQVLLSTQTGNRDLLDQGLDEGRAVLANYGIGHDADWTDHYAVRVLPAEQREELRSEFGELLLLMARADMLRGGPDDREAAGSALTWNRRAEECSPVDRRPHWLSRQRAELLARLPGAAEAIPEGPGSDLDPYHDGLAAAVQGRHVEALTALTPFT